MIFTSCLLSLLIYFVFRFCCLNYAETTDGRQLALAWFFIAIELLVLSRCTW